MKGLLINRLLWKIQERGPSRHLVGLPVELTEGRDESERLPHPGILTIEENPAGQVFLFRYTPDGEPVGDTWHQTVENAIEQARSEYSEVLGPWHEVPPGRDALEFAMHNKFM